MTDLTQKGIFLTVSDKVCTRGTFYLLRGRITLDRRKSNLWSPRKKLQDEAQKRTDTAIVRQEEIWKVGAGVQGHKFTAFAYLMLTFEEELWDLSQLSVFYFECLLKNGVLSRIGESSQQFLGVKKPS